MRAISLSRPGALLAQRVSAGLFIALQPDTRREPASHDTAPFAHVLPTSRRGQAERPVVPTPRSGAHGRAVFRTLLGGLLGVPRGNKEQEIRVRTGKFGFQPGLRASGHPPALKTYRCCLFSLKNTNPLRVGSRLLAARLMVSVLASN
jgi:hypothetical protein